MILDPLLRGTRLLVCVGPGGVGKTSLAAAIALAAAHDGRRVFLLTIDPARRLAGALGTSLSDEGADVAMVASAGRVRAAMLETEASWDGFVARIAPDAGSRSRILANRVYRAFSRTLARSHAYVALERIHAILDEQRAGVWDLAVLDTPPTRSALDLVDAPPRLARFVESRIANALAGRRLGGASRMLGRLMGGGLAAELGEFLATFAPLREGFAARAAEVRAALTSPETAFALVADPGMELGDASFLAGDLARRHIALRAILFNRAFHAGAAEVAWDREAGIAALAPVAGEVEAALVIDAAIEARRDVARADARADRAMRSFAARHPAAIALAFPMLDREPCSPAELSALARAAAVR